MKYVIFVSVAAIRLKEISPNSELKSEYLASGKSQPLIRVSESNLGRKDQKFRIPHPKRVDSPVKAKALIQANFFRNQDLIDDKNC